MQSEKARLKSQSAQKPCSADPEFHFTGNKKQYHLPTDDGKDHTTC